MKRNVSDRAIAFVGTALVAVTVLPLTRWAGAFDTGSPWSNYLSSWVVGAIRIVSNVSWLSDLATCFAERLTRLLAPPGAD